MYNQIAANRNRTIFLMAIFLCLVIALGYAFSYYYNNPNILWFAVVFSLFMNWFSYFHSDTIALAASGARPANADSLDELELIHIVENLAIADGLPTPKVYIIDDQSPNAFATGRDSQHASVAVTRGLMQLLTKAEMEGALAHELSHVKNYDILLSTIVVTLVGVITLAGDWFVRANMFRGGGDRNNNNSNAIFAVLAVVFIILSPIFAQLIQLAISRKREFLADASGALLTRYPEGLASALEKIGANSKPMRRANRATAHLFIADPFGDRLGRRVAGLFSTHPPIEQRIKALKEMSL